MGRNRPLARSLREAGRRESARDSAGFRPAVRLRGALHGRLRICLPLGSEPLLPGPVFGLCLGAAAVIPPDGGARGGRHPPRVRGAALRDGGRHRRTRRAHGPRAGAVERVRHPAARVFERNRRRSVGNPSARALQGVAGERSAIHPAGARGRRDDLRRRQREPGGTGRSVPAVRRRGRANPRGGGFFPAR